MKKVLVDIEFLQQVLDAIDSVSVDYRNRAGYPVEVSIDEDALLAAAAALREVIKHPALEQVAWGVDWGSHGERTRVSIIKKHQNGTIEVVATEYEPPRNRV